MNYYFITGTSSGIGAAMANLLLQDKNNKVFGISRRQKINESNFVACAIDLSILDEITGFEFPNLENPDQIFLINNAGQIGDIKPIGKSDNQAIADLMTVNVTAPTILMNNFITKYADLNIGKTILNVSSGAGKNAIEGWAPYCGSKAAIDLVSLTMFEEQKRVKFPFQIFSVAPGVVDTEMQDTIRESNEGDFSKYAHFVALKENNELSSPQEVAEKYLRILRNPQDFEECIFSLRDL